MSKESLLQVGNFNLFTNTNEKIEFSVKKDEKVVAEFSSYDKEKAFDVRGISVLDKNGKSYLRLVISTGSGDSREFHNASLFSNEKQKDSQPDFTGRVNLTNEVGGATLRLAAWNKVGPKGPYRSVAISEVKSAQLLAEHPEVATHSDSDLNDVPF